MAEIWEMPEASLECGAVKQGRENTKNHIISLGAWGSTLRGAPGSQVTPLQECASWGHSSHGRLGLFCGALIPWELSAVTLSEKVAFHEFPESTDIEIGWEVVGGHG